MATSLLLAFAIVFMVIGLTLVRQDGCAGACETLGLTLLYAGGPISAAFGVGFGALVLAWPLDITLWVVLGFLLSRARSRDTGRVAGVSLLLVAVALAYGLVLSQLVEIAVQN